MERAMNLRRLSRRRDSLPTATLPDLSKGKEREETAPTRNSINIPNLKRQHSDVSAPDADVCLWQDDDVPAMGETGSISSSQVRKKTRFALVKESDSTSSSASSGSKGKGKDSNIQSDAVDGSNVDEINGEIMATLAAVRGNDGAESVSAEQWLEKRGSLGSMHSNGFEGLLAGQRLSMTEWLEANDESNVEDSSNMDEDGRSSTSYYEHHSEICAMPDGKTSDDMQVAKSAEFRGLADLPGDAIVNVVEYLDELLDVRNLFSSCPQAGWDTSDLLTRRLVHKIASKSRRPYIRAHARDVLHSHRQPLEWLMFFTTTRRTLPSVQSNAFWYIRSLEAFKEVMKSEEVGNVGEWYDHPMVMEHLMNIASLRKVVNQDVLELTATKTALLELQASVMLRAAHQMLDRCVRLWIDLGLLTEDLNTISARLHTQATASNNDHHHNQGSRSTWQEWKDSGSRWVHSVSGLFTALSVASGKPIDLMALRKTLLNKRNGCKICRKLISGRDLELMLAAFFAKGNPEVYRQYLRQRDAEDGPQLPEGLVIPQQHQPQPQQQQSATSTGPLADPSTPFSAHTSLMSPSTVANSSILDVAKDPIALWVDLAVCLQKTVKQVELVCPDGVVTMPTNHAIGARPGALSIDFAAQAAGMREGRKGNTGSIIQILLSVAHCCRQWHTRAPAANYEPYNRSAPPDYWPIAQLLGGRGVSWICQRLREGTSQTTLQKRLDRCVFRRAAVAHIEDPTPARHVVASEPTKVIAVPVPQLLTSQVAVPNMTLWSLP
eukprot:Clim_evm69s144 gene=Clim_evmTU69s144